MQVFLYKSLATFPDTINICVDLLCRYMIDTIPACHFSATFEAALLSVMLSVHLQMHHIAQCNILSLVAPGQSHCQRG